MECHSGFLSKLPHLGFSPNLFCPTDVQTNAFRKASQMGALQEGGLRADDRARGCLFGSETLDQSREKW